MENSQPIIQTSVLLLMHAFQADEPHYISLVPTFESDEDFYYLPYINIDGDTNIEQAIYDYCDEIKMPLWHYSVERQTVSVSRLKDKTVLTKTVYIVASVDNFELKENLSQKYDGDTVTAFSLTELHDHLLLSPYYSADLRKVITSMKMAV